MTRHIVGMNPRLIAIAGPMEGSIFDLTEEEISVGRERSNQISINDASVSRRHLIIKKNERKFHVEDLGSHNGTRVNGLPVKERALNHGDFIAVGDSLFLFLTDDEEETTPEDPIRFYEDMPDTRTTVHLRLEDAIYLRPERLLSSLPATARMARDLNALLKISAAINSLRKSEDIKKRLLELTFEVMPAERGAILMSGDEERLAVSLHRNQSASEPIRISRTVVNQSIGEGVAVLINNISDEKEFSEVESLREARTQSLICVPLAVFEIVTGALYLDTAGASGFDENHLQLAAAIASIAALALENASHLEWLKSENRRLQDAIITERNMIGESAQMKEVYHFISRIAPSDSTVLICGESGTGKELAARAIHQNSARKDFPFIAINCAVLTDTLLESELFGHEKGAFTGAIAQKRGKLELAHTGTLFLDEVGELAPQLQAKLLRVLQEREFERVGGARPIKIDIRLIAATNRDLEEAIREGKFRQDLYYRLNVVRLTMPPLRQRRADIPLLATYFALKHSQRCKRMVKGLSAEAHACLRSYEWPGNVRELENAVERAVVLGSTDYILPEDLPEDLHERTVSAGIKYYEAVQEAKKRIVAGALDQASGNYAEAARLLGIHPNNLHRLIRKLEMKDELKK